MATIRNKQCRYFVTALCVLVLAHQYGKSQGVLLTDSQYLIQENHFANIKMLTFEEKMQKHIFHLTIKCFHFKEE